MAQPSVAREPSMEEILASIRRIIESNEPGAANGVNGSLSPVYAEEEAESADDIHLTVDDDFNAGRIPVAVDMPDAEKTVSRIPAPANQSSEAVRMEAERSISLADVAARVRAASARISEVGVPKAAPVAEVPAAAPVVATAVAERPVAMPSMPELRGSVESQTPAQVTPFRAPPVIADTLPEAPVPVAAEIQPEVRIKTVAAPVAEPAPAPAAPAVAVAAVEEERLPARVEASAVQALLSAEAGEQVARSFGELAAAFDGVERRSLEDIAGDMMRPMLQEWLDDNLPTLVERLVREEIERVARGPRR